MGEGVSFPITSLTDRGMLKEFNPDFMGTVKVTAR